MRKRKTLELEGLGYRQTIKGTEGNDIVYYSSSHKISDNELLKLQLEVLLDIRDLLSTMKSDIHGLQKDVHDFWMRRS